MASEKTEKPTPKKISDAREQGQVAKSTDFNSAVVLTAATMAMAYMGPYFFNSTYGIMKYTFSQALHNAEVIRPMTQTVFLSLAGSTLQSILLLMMPFLFCIMIMGALGNIMQVKFVFSMKALQPKLDKLNPIAGFKRFISIRSFVELGKSILKMVIIGISCNSVIGKHLPELMGLGGVEVPLAWGIILKVVGEIAQNCCIVFLVLGIADWRYQAYELEKQLRMSKQDIRDESKNSNGDPAMKGKIRAMGQKFARSNQLAAIPTADVVITNPTHYAIALRYDPDIAPAPMVVAKGKDVFAQKIKEIAKENGVPMVENKPLARALYPIVEADTMVPPTLFVAVAEVLAYVFANNKGRRVAAQQRSKEAAAKKADLEKRRKGGAS